MEVDEGVLSDQQDESSLNTTAFEDWLDVLPEDQKERLIWQAIQSLPRYNIQNIFRKLCKLINYDFTERLPLELVLKIFENLSRNDVLKCSKVSHKWKKISKSPYLWHALYVKEGWKYNQKSIEEAQQACSKSSIQFEDAIYCTPHGLNKWIIDWQQLYIDHYFLEERWRLGICTTRPLLDEFGQKVHSETVYAIELHEDYIFTASKDCTIAIWYKERFLRKLFGHQGSVLCLNSSTCPNFRLISGSSDWTVKIWSETELLCSLSGHLESVLSVKTGSKYIVSSSRDKCIKVWAWNSDQTDASFAFNLLGHRAAVNAIQYNESRSLIVSASGDRTIRIWDTDSRACVRVIDSESDGHSRGVACLSLYGDLIVSGSSDLSIRIFDIAEDKCLKVLYGHRGLVRTIQSNGRKIVSGSYDEFVCIWTLPETSSEMSPEERNAKISQMEGKFVPLIHEPEEFLGRIFHLQFDETRIVSCSQKGDIMVWDFHGSSKHSFF